ncbi:hypothetical protein E4U41_000356 [Claviceps citrina]|nr:hypothetical protein E4U41_000356 [Claviceps citrina]
MGRTYYYYYEIDGSTETHDAAQPSTTACPYLPGQTVNTLYIPIQQTLRSRSASVSSLRQEAYMTMDPQARFVTPVPLPSALASPAIPRLGSASSLLQHHAKGRSESVGPSWKRFFGRNVETQPGERMLCDSTSPPFLLERRRTRHVSPESLRRFLADDAPPSKHAVSGVSSLNVPSKLDDDNNSDTSAVSETRLSGIGLSPFPAQRSGSTCTLSREIANSSSLTLTGKCDAREQVPRLSELETNEVAQSDWSSALSSTTFTAPMSPRSLVGESTYCYDSDDSEDMLSNTDGDYLSYPSPSEDMPASEALALQRYSLPRHSVEDNALKSADAHQMRGAGTTAPILTARGSDIPVAVTNFLGEPIDTGLDDFVSELGLMVEDIGKRQS